MKKHYFLLSFILFISPVSQAQNIFTCGGKSSESVTDIEIDKQENVLCAVRNLSDTLYSGGSVFYGSGAHLVKIRPDNTIAWQMNIGNGSYSSDLKEPVIGIDQANGYYITGYYSDTFTIGNLTLTDTGDNAFIAKLDTNGAPIYLKRLGNRILVRDLCFDSQGNILIAGMARGNAATLRGDSIHTYGNTSDLLLARLTPQADVIWQTHAGGVDSYSEYLTSVCVDAADNIYVGGSIRSNSTFNSISLPVVGTAGYSGVVAKYNSSGVAQWAKLSGDFVNSVACSAGGEVIAAGEGSNRFDTIMVPAIHGYIAGFNGNGGLKFVHAVMRADSTVAPTGNLESVIRLSNGNFMAAGVAPDSFYFANMLYTGGAISPNAFTITIDVDGNALQKYQVVLSNSTHFLAIDKSECTLAMGGLYGYQDPNPVYDTLERYGSLSAWVMVNKVSSDCESITGITATSGTKLILYPNPTNGVMHTLVDGPVTSLNCYDIAGRVCNVPYTYSGNLLTLNVWGLQAGMYVLHVNNTVTRFVKQ